MSERSVRDDLREFYDAKQLSPRKMEHLQTILGGLDRRHRFKMQTFSSVAAAAAIAIAIPAVLILLFEGGTGGVPQLIADEIAMNHHKQLAADFKTTSYSDLRQMMDKLDFTVTEPSRSLAQGLSLKGARYCSIRGQLAAQLRLETAAGESVTLFQTASSHDLRDIEVAQLRSGGLIIDLWQEDGVLLGMARGPS